MPFPDTREDLNVFVDDLTEQMERRFATMRASIMTKLDDMGHHVDALERDLNALAVQAGIEVPDSKRPSLQTSMRSSFSSDKSATSGAVEI